MERRNFIKLSAAVATVSAVDFYGLQEVCASQSSGNTATQKDGDLVAVMGDKPEVLLTRAIAELGGMDKFVKSGDKVVLKPNAGWAKGPELAANANPFVIGALTKLCFEHGAKEVKVFDHTCNDWNKCYDLSGIKREVEAAGGKMIPGNNESYYKEVALPKGKILKSAKIHEALLDCDVWFNIPVLKHHSGAKMTVSMKNYMGIVWDRRYFHKKGLQQCIADIGTWEKKPALHIVDAFRSLTQNGPQGKSEADVAQTRALFASEDPVAVDTVAIKFFSQLKPVKLEDVGHLAFGEEHQLGSSDLSRKNIKRIKI